jgi:hypothetical protein
MGHRNRNTSNNDPRSSEARRANAEGRPARNHQPEPSWTWCKPGEPSERACLQILRGEIGMYPIFGLQLSVEERGRENDKFSALVYYGALDGPDGQNLSGVLKDGFWIGTKELLRDPSLGFKDEDREVLILTVLGQPEMQFALSEFRQEQARAREADALRRQQEEEKMTEKRKSVLATLRQQQSEVVSAPVKGSEPSGGLSQKRQKPDRPQLARFGEITMAQEGTITWNGLELYLAKAPQGGTAIRLKMAPEGHEFEEIARRNLFVLQNAIIYADDRPSENPQQYQGNDALRYRFRMWIRQELQKNGMTLLPPADYESHSGNGAGKHPSEESSGNVPGAEASAAS